MSEVKARVRRDLVEQGINVPVADEFVSDVGWVSHQYIAEDVFVVEIDGEWKQAVSADWEFEPQESL